MKSTQLERFTTIGYLRVSTTKQNTEKFKKTIKQYCKSKGLLNLSFIEEIISGTIDYKDRVLFDVIEDKKVKSIIVPELSRIGRTARQILKVIEDCRNNHIEIHCIKENLIITDKKDISTMVMIHTFSLMAEIERQLISERTKEALQALKNKGVKLGRKKGVKIGSKLDKDKGNIFLLLEKKVSITQISKNFNVSRQTMYNFIKNNPFN